MSTKLEAPRAGIDVLSIGHGDIKITFGDDPQEVARAAIAVRDMLRRGYALFVHGADGKLIRVLAFDDAKREYVIGAGPDPELVAGAQPEPLPDAAQSSHAPPAGVKRGPGRPRRVPMTGVRATMVGRSAGG